LTRSDLLSINGDLKVAKSFLKSRPWSTGVMEYWGVEKKDINPLVIAPTLQYSEINRN
jgi:hypothetical protein